MLKEYYCDYCNQTLEFGKQVNFASHKSGCKFNPKLLNGSRSRHLKEIALLKNPISTYTFNCQKCNEEYKLDLKLTQFNKGTYKKFCSRKCANFRIFSEESNLKKSNSALNSDKVKEAGENRKGFYYKKIGIKEISKNKEIKSLPKNKIKTRKIKSKIKESNCVICNKEIIGIRKTCSVICKNYLASLNRQKSIAKNGTFNFKTIQEPFSYKFLNNFKVDSNLEKAGIVYLIDVLGADKIEKFKSILNFWENDKHRTFNPDFYVKKGNEIYIVEVKMKWSKTSQHSYNRTIPLKKEALDKFCKDKGYEMIWLDFDYDKKLRQIYKQIKIGAGA